MSQLYNLPDVGGVPKDYSAVNINLHADKPENFLNKSH